MDLKEILHMVGLAAKAGPAIDQLVKAGKPVAEAVKENAPELHAAFEKLGDAAFGPSVPATAGAPAASSTSIQKADHAKVIAKAIFTPHDVAPHEQVAIDRASNPLAGGGM